MRSLHSLALLAEVTLVVFIFVPHVHAQADLTFSGGDGAPLQLTLNAPVTYVVTTASDGVGLGFDFQGVGNLFAEKAYVTGTITYAVDGGTPMSVPYFNSGFAGGGVAATDVYLFGAMSGVAVGDIVVLNAGTLTTNADFEDAPPLTDLTQPSFSTEMATSWLWRTEFPSQNRLLG